MFVTQELHYHELLKSSHRSSNRWSILSADFAGYRLRCGAGLGYYEAVKQVGTLAVHLVPATLFSGTGSDMYRARELYFSSSIEETQWVDA